MSYNLRDIQHGQSNGFKVQIDPSTGRPIGLVIPVTGLVNTTANESQNVVAYKADTTVVFTTNNVPTFTIAVSQYQFNHALGELALHGYTYSSISSTNDTHYLDPTSLGAYMFWYVVQHTNGKEELVVWTNCVSEIIANVGDAQTDDTSIQPTLYTYNVLCNPSNHPSLNSATMYKTTDPTSVNNAKNGVIPIPVSQFTLDNSTLSGYDVLG